MKGSYDMEKFIFDKDETYVTAKDNFPVHIFGVFDMNPNRKVIAGVIINHIGHQYLTQWDMDGTCHNPNLSLKVKNPPKQLVIDQPIWVKQRKDGSWTPYHFAFMKDGKCWCWVGGKTSHSSYGDTDDVFGFEFWTDQNPY